MVWFMRTAIAAVLSGPALVCSQNRLFYSLWMRLPLKCVGYRCAGSPRFRYRAPEFTVVVTGLVVHTFGCCLNWPRSSASVSLRQDAVCGYAHRRKHVG